MSSTFLITATSVYYKEAGGGGSITNFYRSNNPMLFDHRITMHAAPKMFPAQINGGGGLATPIQPKNPPIDLYVQYSFDRHQ